jgi:nucleoid-associated protein YgaU
MDRLEQLKTKYAPAMKAIEATGVRLQNLHVQDDKLFLKGAAPSVEAKNLVWDAIKSVDATYSDMLCDITIDPALPAPASKAAERTYTVVGGDTLSKISKQFYGDAGKYMKIFEANTDILKDPHMIKVGQVLKIPG